MSPLLKFQILCRSLDLKVQRRLPEAGVLMWSGEIAVTLGGGEETLSISLGKDKLGDFAVSHF